MAYKYIGFTYGGYSGQIITWDYWHGFDYGKISQWFAHRIEWAENGAWEKSKDVEASHADWKESGGSISNYCAVGFCLAKIPDDEVEAHTGNQIDSILLDERCLFNYLPFDTVYRPGLAYRAKDVVGNVVGASKTDEYSGLWVNCDIADIGDLVLIQNLPLVDEIDDEILDALMEKLGITSPDPGDEDVDSDEDYECWYYDKAIDAVNKKLKELGLPKIGWEEGCKEKQEETGAETLRVNITTYYFTADCCVEGKHILLGYLRDGTGRGVFDNLDDAIERANELAKEEAENGTFKGIGVYSQDVPPLDAINPFIRGYFTGEPAHDIIGMCVWNDATLITGADTVDGWASVYDTYKNTGEIKVEQDTKTEQ